MIILHAVIAIVAIVLLITRLKVDPVIALVLGSIYLGLTAGLGLEGTLVALVDGFGSIMAEVGLLIGFGVLLGALLHSTGALQRFVRLILRLLGPKRLPYALGTALTAVFPSIYVDVQLVLAAPLARTAAPSLGRNGLGLLAGAISAGILVGYVFVIPGLGTISIAGLLGVDLASMLGWGLLVGVATVILTVLTWSLLVKAGFWNPERDEDASEALLASEAAARQVETGIMTVRRRPPLALALVPVAVPLVLIAFGAIAEVVGIASEVTAFFGNPVLALFLGVLVAYVLAQVYSGREETDASMSRGFSTTGQILVITGVGGSLGEIIGLTELRDVLAGLFSGSAGGASVLVAILLAWVIAAVLHLAIGSISVAAIAASGIISPVLGSIDVSPIIIGLSIGAGALFALQVNSNFFWMFQSLLGVNTRGALKALTLVTALASVIALPLILLLSFIV